ncbi:MAG TPA: multicopper oxidase domain-containing protein, partial [Rhodanobacteraceae bacterium]|nr:multicopper oxidase domain-containing protein [Rhodanobacteraceae bacterium]
RPERDMQPNRVLAFAETGGRLTTPGPLIRVREGTRLAIAWHNRTGDDVYVHGFATSRDAPPLRVPAHGEAATEFDAASTGTFYYWGSLKPVAAFSEDRDSQLAGAFVVDPAAGAPNDRIFVIKRLGADFEGVSIGSGLGAWAINGRSWPETERLTYSVGEKIEWRFINPTSHRHPMHLHGTYFRVTHEGDGTHDVAVPAERQKLVVTEAMHEGGTMTIEWSPERPGNWLFHCHVMFHVVPENRLHDMIWYDEYADLPHDRHMAGLVLGVHAVAANAAMSAPANAPRRMTLRVAERPGVTYEGEGLKGPGLGYALDGGPVSAPGPVIALERDRPVEITVVNTIRHATAVHWHGIELESYYDGVPHWGGNGTRLMPDIAPGAQFVARFTPPRAGTFIYHTHFNDYVQLASGLYGPLIITEPGHAFAPATDHVFVFGQHGFEDDKSPLLVNGAAALPETWRAGVHRVRLIGMTPNNSVNVTLTRDGAPATWTPRARDGADLPDTLRTAGTAKVEVFPGQTYDYDVVADAGTLRLEGVLSEGDLRASATLAVAP